MKIAIASDDKLTIAAHFGRTRGFVIYNINDQNIEEKKYRPNTFTGHARGLEHAGHEVDRHGPVLNALGDCAVVISHGMGRRMYDDLKNAGIQSIITAETHIRTALDAYVKGELIDQPERGCKH